MFALEQPIADRLDTLFLAQFASAPWQVRKGSEETPRKVHPALDVRCSGANAADIRNTAVEVSVEWAVTLVVPQGTGAMALLDTAFGLVIGSLHNWGPGTQGNRDWQRLQFTNVGKPEFSEGGLIAYTLTFNTSAQYQGQP